jgi:hypothetical protein
VTASVASTETSPILQAHWPVGIGLMCLALAAVYQLLCVAQPIEFLNQHVLLMDDVYYYFQVARNLALRNWATFDGLHSTSGIQLLWGLVLWLVALLSADKLGFIRAVLVLSTLLNGIAGLALWRLGRDLYSVEVGDLAALFWSGFMVGLLPTLMGLEYPLHAVTAVAITAICWRMFVERDAVPAPSRLLLLGGLLAVNYWVRLDSALISLLIWCGVGGLLFRRRTASRSFAIGFAALSLPPVLGAVAYVATCWHLAGTVMPISGLVKQDFAAQHFRGYSSVTSLAGHLFWWVRIESRALLDVLDSSLLTMHRPLGEPVPLTVLGLVLVATAITIRRLLMGGTSDPRRRRAAVFVGLLWLLASLHAALVVTTIGHFSHVTQHYYAWLWLACCLWTAVMVQGFLARLSSSRMQRRAITVGVVAFLGVHAWDGVGRFVLNYSPNLHNRRLPVMTWMREHLPPDARIGAWNAGQLGYFSDRTIVNLDGLANDLHYLRYLQNGIPVREYLMAENIDYLIDVNEPDLTMPFRAAWDRSRLFRNTLLWSELEILYVEEGQPEPIVVVRLRGTGVTEGNSVGTPRRD